MSRSKQAAKSALIVMIFTLGSKILGFIREILASAGSKIASPRYGAWHRPIFVESGRTR